MTMSNPASLAAVNQKEDDQVIIGDTFDCLLDELQLCLRYHQGIFPDRTVENWYLSVAIHGT